MPKNYYQILGVDKTATDDQIKKAFRKLAHEHHPDKTNGSADKFKEINEAYQVLSNKDKRQQYDQFGTTFEAGQGFSGANPFSGFASGGAWDFGNINFSASDDSPFGDIGDIFGSFFAGGPTRRQTRTKRGADIQIDLEISLAEAVFGSNQLISLRKQKKCPECGGTGAKEAKDFKNCPTCAGSGQVASHFGPFRTQSTCPECLGQGKIIKNKCSYCHGQGATTEDSDIRIEVPAGIDDGQSVRLSGQGHSGLQGVSAGDLYVRLRVRPEPSFNRQGHDLLTEKLISFTTAALGGEVEVPTIDGRVKLKIPAGTPSGKKFILRGQGVTKLRGKGRGDQIVTVNVAVPTRLSKKQKKLLEELEREINR